jgi:hypothetical protein
MRNWPNGKDASAPTLRESRLDEPDEELLEAARRDEVSVEAEFEAGSLAAGTHADPGSACSLELGDWSRAMDTAGLAEFD